MIHPNIIESELIELYNADTLQLNRFVLGDNPNVIAKPQNKS